MRRAAQRAAEAPIRPRNGPAGPAEPARAGSRPDPRGGAAPQAPYPEGITRLVLIVPALVAGLLLPAAATAGAPPVIGAPVQANWSGQPSPTGEVMVSVPVRGASRVTATAAGHTWKLKPTDPAKFKLRGWSGTIRNKRVTNYVARPRFTVTIKACNAGGCARSVVHLRSA